MYDPNRPYNDLPQLPPHAEVETKKVLREVIAASRILAELKDRVNEIPNQSMLVNAITLQEAKNSSEIENIVTTQDSLYQAFSGNVNTSDTSNSSRVFTRA